MKKQKSNVVMIVDQQAEARNNFASHVQSIAFNLTLSRRMIDCLQSVRDYGWPHLGNEATKEDRAKNKENNLVVTRFHNRGDNTFTTHNFVGFMKALSNRGLIYWNEKDYRQRKLGERTLFLSRAGELTCDLLVEGGLMAPRVDVKKQQSK